MAEKETMMETLRKFAETRISENPPEVDRLMGEQKKKWTDWQQKMVDEEQKKINRSLETAGLTK